MPVSGIVPIPSASLADRYLYVPAIGLWIVIAGQSSRLFSFGGKMRRYTLVAVGIILTVLSGLTMARNRDWKNDLTLFSGYVEQNPNRAFGHFNLGCAYLEQVDDLDAAEREFKKALSLDPVFPRLRTQLGHVRLIREDYEGALRHYDQAVIQNTFDTEAHLNRGIALEKLGRAADAVVEYRFFLASPGIELAEARPFAEQRVRELTQ